MPVRNIKNKLLQMKWFITFMKRKNEKMARAKTLNKNDLQSFSTMILSIFINRIFW
jgi:hypothetical protein